MAWTEVCFEFSTWVTEDSLRASLGCEVGERAAWARNIDIDVGDSDGGRSVVLGSLDPVAMVYAEKICVADGATRHPPRRDPIPGWTQTPWIELGAWKRFRLWLGPTRL